MSFPFLFIFPSLFKSFFLSFSVFLLLSFSHSLFLSIFLSLFLSFPIIFVILESTKIILVHPKCKKIFDVLSNLSFFNIVIVVFDLLRWHKLSLLFPSLCLIFCIDFLHCIGSWLLLYISRLIDVACFCALKPDC